MSTRGVVAPEALEQAEAIDGWWRLNRPSAPGLFADELASALATVSEAPHIGRRIDYDDDVVLRRLLLRSSRFHVYYSFEDGTVRVLAVWSALRGRGPDLTQL